MKIQEAIKWIFELWHEWENVYGVSGEQVLKEGKKMDEVIELLQRGEKFEKMWGELCERVYRIDSKFSNIRNIIEKLETKHFPEIYALPKCSKDFTEKVMEKINKEADNEIKMD